MLYCYILYSAVAKIQFQSHSNMFTIFYIKIAEVTIKTLIRIMIEKSEH